MEYSFNCRGHENITANHKTTLEFTRDKDVSLNGDCIVGVKADFELASLKEFIKNKQNNNSKKIPIKVIIKIDDLKEVVNGFLNADFNDSNEIVIRKSDFISGRTLVYGADKGAYELNRNVKSMLKNHSSKARVILK